MPQMNDEKRLHERYAYPSRIEYVLDSDLLAAVRPAVTINISDTGLSLYAFSQHTAGEEIVITSDLPLEHRRAMICWVRHEHDVMYKLGVKFINGEIRPHASSGRA